MRITPCGPLCRPGHAGGHTALQCRGTPHARRRMQIRVGLNSGEVVVRAIGNDLHMDYSAIGQTTHLAARWSSWQRLGASPDCRDAAAGRGAGAGHRPGTSAGQGPGGAGGVWELVGVSALRRRLQVAAARGLTRFVGRQPELATSTGPGAGRGRAGAGGGHRRRSRRREIAPGL